MRFTLKLVGAFLCAFMAWEVILECFVVRSPGAQTHPVLGRVFKPGIYVHGDEGYALTRVNRLGLRNREIGPKAPGVFRVLMLGDSYTEGYQVADSQTFCALTEMNLRKAFGPRIEVINAGHSGRSPADYIHLADYYRSAFQPDFVVIQMNLGDFTNDLMNRHLSVYIAPDGDGFKTVENKKLESDDPFAERFSKHSLSFLSQVSTFRVASEHLTLMRSKPNADSEPVSPDRSLTEERTRALDWSIAEQRRKYPNLLLIYLPRVDYEHPSKNPSVIEAAVVAAAARHGAPLIDMRADFVDAYLARRQPANGFNNTQPGFGHINALGHALAAERISNFLIREISQKRSQ